MEKVLLFYYRRKVHAVLVIIFTQNLNITIRKLACPD